MIPIFYDTAVTNMALLLCNLVTNYSTIGPYLGFLEDSSYFGLASIPFSNYRTSLSCGKLIVVVGWGQHNHLQLQGRHITTPGQWKHPTPLATAVGSGMGRWPQQSQFSALHATWYMDSGIEKRSFFFLGLGVEIIKRAWSSSERKALWERSQGEVKHSQKEKSSALMNPKVWLHRNLDPSLDFSVRWANKFSVGLKAVKVGFCHLQPRVLTNSDCCWGRLEIRTDVAAWAPRQTPFHLKQRRHGGGPRTAQHPSCILANSIAHVTIANKSRRGGIRQSPGVIWKDYLLGAKLKVIGFLSLCFSHEMHLTLP